MDLSVRRVAQGSRYPTKDKTSKKGLKNIQKSIATLSHLAAAPTAANRTACDIGLPRYQILDLFGQNLTGAMSPLT